MGAVAAGVATALLIIAIFLNDGALSVEEWLAWDYAFEAFAIGALLALVLCLFELRSALRQNAGSATSRMVLAASAGIAAVIGAFLAITEPAVFNAGYQCLGSGATQAWLAVAMRPSPAPCGYVIPASDDSLFFPAAFAAFGAAALCAVSVLLNIAGRRSAPA
ncbi:MAG: hypothetical protein ACRD9W_07745 [Terriglobia bacterium]